MVKLDLVQKVLLKSWRRRNNQTSGSRVLDEFAETGAESFAGIQGNFFGSFV